MLSGQVEVSPHSLSLWERYSAKVMLPVERFSQDWLDFIDASSIWKLRPSNRKAYFVFVLVIHGDLEPFLKSLDPVVTETFRNAKTKPLKIAFEIVFSNQGFLSAYS